MVRGAEARRDVQPAATTLRVNKVKPGISRAGMERRAEILGRPAQGIQRRRTAGNHINARVRIMSVSSRASLGGTIAQGSIRGVPATKRFNCDCCLRVKQCGRARECSTNNKDPVTVYQGDNWSSRRTQHQHTTLR